MHSDDYPTEETAPSRACRKCAAVSKTHDNNCPECGASFSRRSVGSVVPITTLVVVAVALPLIAAAFFIGQSTRTSDQQVNKELASTAATQRAIDGKRAKTKTHNLLVRQEKKIKKVLNKRAKKKAQKAYENGSANGYSSGNAAGYSSGHDDGSAEGLDYGVDLGACLADYAYC